MFAKVRVLEGLSQALWYAVPEHLISDNLTGSVVRVPLRNRETFGLIESVSDQKPAGTFALRAIVGCEALPADTHYMQFLTKLSQYYHVPIITLLRRIKHFIQQESLQEVDEPHESVKVRSTYLTSEQEEIALSIMEYVNAQVFKPILLHGVTGSGKSEVYKYVMQQVLDQGKSIIFLVPEVTLAVQFGILLSASFSSDVLYGFHSATSAAHKKALINRLKRKLPCIILGVHLPILLPLEQIGLIIVDEEHEVGYQEKKHPRMNSKEIALIRAQTYHVPIIMGSATPSVNSLYNVAHRGWIKYSLTKRYAGSFPTIKIISLKNFKQRREFWFSDELLTALKDRLAKKEQSIIFLNRRGHSFFVQCKSCSFVFECSSCAVSMTLHEDDVLRCHYCDYSIPLPSTCSCKNSGTFLKKGIGTQQVVKILQRLFPQAVVERADLDATVDRKRWQATLQRMHEGSIDILVGTQTITKGYDFKRLTLVGILWADLNLHFPMYNASETTLQQILQVAGRAGRHTGESLVLVQTMTDHYIFSHLSESRYEDFYKQELGYREQCKYPPFVRLAEIEVRHKDKNLVDADAQVLVDALRTQISQTKSDIVILGPAEPPVHKIKNIYRKRICLKSSSVNAMTELFKFIERIALKSDIFFHQNPL